MVDTATQVSLDVEVDQFIELLGADDQNTSVMLRVHLVTENLLERAIIARLPGGDALIDNANLTYNHKLEIFNAFHEAKPSLIGSLRQLNKVRNAASHVRETSVGRPEIEKIGRPLGKGYVKLRQKHSADLQRLTVTVLALVFARLLTAVSKIESESD